MRFLLFTFLISALLFLANFAFATDMDPESQIRQKARTHAYPGGIDEEPLKVQEQLPIVGRKMQPAQEPVEQEDVHASDSND